jgi:limonene-1,2-epoxide hydrolase
MDDAAAIKLVEDLSEACHRGEYDRFPEFLTDDAVFHMVPLPPVTGIAAITEEWKKLAGMGTVEVKISNVAAKDGVVFTERVDSLQRADGRGDLPVVAVFEIRDGKVAAWRDYFDMKQALDAFGLDEVI